MTNGIGLVQVDGKLPNLALMKISNYYKQEGIPVEFAQAGEQVEVDCNAAHQKITCLTCHASWNDLYLLSGIERIDDED